MCLPAAHETVKTWILGFGMQPMPDEDLDAACKDLRLLIFPGTQVLHKQLLPRLPLKQGPLMTPPWAEEDEPAALPTDGQPAFDTPSEPQQELDADTVIPPLSVLEAQAAASAAATAVAAPSDMLGVTTADDAQPEVAPTVPSVAAAGAADEAPLGEPVTGAWSDPLPTVEGVEDTVMAVPTEVPDHSEAVLQHAQDSHPAPAGAEAAVPYDASRVDSCEKLAGSNLVPESAAALHGLGVQSQAGFHGQASPEKHLQQDPGIRENGVAGKGEEACAVTSDAFLQVQCTYSYLAPTARMP